MELRLRLKKKLARVLSAGHPWIFKNALEGVQPKPGEIVTVVDSKGEFVARGIADAGPIAVRVFTTRDRPVDASIFRQRMQTASAMRDRLLPPDTNAFRLLHGEGDRLPGVVCDVYDAYAVLRFDGQGIEHWRKLIVELLTEILRPRGVGHLLVRSGRGSQLKVEAVFGIRLEQPIPVIERGMRLMVDLVKGQKTGLFLDHRESRWKIRSLAKDLSVLNLYGYTGGFSVAAGLGDAKTVTTVDIAPAAVDLAARNWELNGLETSRHETHISDVSAFLENPTMLNNQRYDLIISDPPSFAPREANVESALKGYTNLHRAALDLVAPGGYFLAASCSSHVGRDAFEQTLLEGARRARRVIQVLDRWGAPIDHPRLLAFPEGDYLKAILSRLIA